MGRYETYVGVIFGDEVRFVTGIPSRNTAEWKAGEPAKKFSEDYAKDIVFGLTFNGYTACVMKFLKGIELRNKDSYEVE